MAIPHNIRAIARQAYGYTLRTGHCEQTIGAYSCCVGRTFKEVVVRLDDNNRWIVPVAKSW